MPKYSVYLCNLHLTDIEGENIDEVLDKVEAEYVKVSPPENGYSEVDVNNGQVKFRVKNETGNLHPSHFDFLFKLYRTDETRYESFTWEVFFLGEKVAEIPNSVMETGTPYLNFCKKVIKDGQAIYYNMEDVPFLVVDIQNDVHMTDVFAEGVKGAFTVRQKNV